MTTGSERGARAGFLGAERQRNVSLEARITVHANPPAPVIPALTERLGAAHVPAEAVDLGGKLVERAPSIRRG